MGVFLTLCIVGLIFRMWYLQNHHGDEYNRFAAAQRARRDIHRNTEIFTPTRGGFVDRHMQPLTGTRQVFTVTLDVYALHTRYNRARSASQDTYFLDELFNAASVELNIPRWRLQDAMATDHYGRLAMVNARRRFVLASEVPADIAIPLADMFPEINIEEDSLRWFQDPFFAPQVIGFARGDARPWGLEGQYQAELEGVQGRAVWVQGETETVPVQDGFTIVTTLDSTIQRLAQEHVDRAFIQHPSQFVGMIVMDPRTGEILAMAQAPSFSLADPFNPDYFTCPTLIDIWDDLSGAEQTTEVMSLWRNYHTTRSSEPGSTFKPFVIAAAYEEGLIDRHSVFHCDGRRDIVDQRVWCHNTWGCGTLPLRRALYRSCNMAMVDINAGLGRDLFYQYRGYFGFGERTGIDLPAEEAVSSRYVMYPWAMLHSVEMATSSMGQGFNATTIQMINGYAALINGGNLMRPFLVSQIVDNQGNVVSQTEPTIVRRAISEETSDFIRNELRYVVSLNQGAGSERGTGWRSYITGHSIGGKTGTAQQGIRGGGEYILTFVSFMPVEDPQFLVLITIDRPEDNESPSAGYTVAPLARNFYADLIRTKNIPPSDGSVVQPEELTGAPMPDFSGQRLSSAVETVINMGRGGYHVVGGGRYISHHMPAPNQPMPYNSPVIFFMDTDTRVADLMVTVPNVVGLTAEVAEFVLGEMGLGTVVFTDRPQVTNDADLRPRTAMPETIDPYELANRPPLPYIVHQQFPPHGSEIEIGTQVKLRAR